MLKGHSCSVWTGQMGGVFPCIPNGAIGALFSHACFYTPEAVALLSTPFTPQNSQIHCLLKDNICEISFKTM